MTWWRGCEQSEQTEGLKKKEASPIYVNPSFNPPYGVLPAPRPGSLLGTTTNQKLSPLAGKVAANVMSSRKGNNSKQPSAASYSPSVTAYAATPSPHAVALFGCGTNSNIKPALKGEVGFA